MLLDKFLKYVKIETQSNEDSETTPSSKNQFNLLNLLKYELELLNVKSEIDEYGRLYAHVEGNPELDPIGLCAHVDTASECSDENVQPQIIRNYDLSDIKLGSSGLVLSPKEYKVLNNFKGKTIITTDGTTLLGADDKAGVAIIMETLEKYLTIDKNNRHPMCILFTPDEEIGRGAEHFDAKKYGAKFAYTIDGSEHNAISIENFNAKSLDVEIVGKSIHPGDAYGIMVNASNVLSEFIMMLPQDMTPSTTKNREGFFHVTNTSSSVELANAHIIIRNHDADILDKQVQIAKDIQVKLQEKYPTAKINLTFKDQYRNMIEIINNNLECKNHIENVYKSLGIEYYYEPIRGGTDGATFSFKGCPCPNLGTGSYNHHGRFEFAVLEEMEILVNICLKIFTL